MAISSLGGLGKSQLAIEYACGFAERQGSTWIFWIHASSQAQVEDGFRKIADALQLAGREDPKANNIPLLVHNWLSDEENGKWIVVVDGVDKDGVLNRANESSRDQRPLESYLPQTRNGCVIYTTRGLGMAAGLAGGTWEYVIQVGRMTEADALALVEKKLGPCSDANMVAEFLKTLVWGPLAIDLAAAYIKAKPHRRSMKKYVTKFRNGSEKLRKVIRQCQRDGGDMWDGLLGALSVVPAWQISFDYIRCRRPSAANLLCVMSFFDVQGIPKWVLSPLRKTANDAMQSRILAQDGDSESEDDDDESDADLSADARFEEDVAVLARYRLITVNAQGDKFEMNKFVRISTLAWLRAYDNDVDEIFLREYIERMAASFPTGEPKDWAICRDLFAQVQTAVGYKPTEDVLEQWATLCHNAGQFAMLQGNYFVAERMAAKAKEAREKRLGKDDALTLQSASLLASITSEIERLNLPRIPTRPAKVVGSTYRAPYWFVDAKRRSLESLETSKVEFGAKSLQTMIIVGTLAYAQHNMGEWEEAEKLGLEVVEVLKAELGAQHWQTLESMNTLVQTYQERGRWTEAEQLVKETMEVWKTQTQGQAHHIDHIQTLTSMSDLAYVWAKQGRFKEAEKLGTEALEAMRVIRKRDDTDVAHAKHNLAAAYEGQGRWEEAEKLERDAMEIYKEKLEPTNPLTLRVMYDLAHTLKAQGRDEDALAMMQECLEGRRLSLGQEHPHTMASSDLVQEWS